MRDKLASVAALLPRGMADCRWTSLLSAEEQAAAMASTVQRAVVLLRWQQQKQQQQEAAGSNNFLDQQDRLDWLFFRALNLPVECLLLQPSADMASSCLTLFIPLAQQATTAGLVTARDALVNDTVSTALQQLGPAVYHAAQRAGSLKQRRQLMRLWSDALLALQALSQGEVLPCWHTCQFQNMRMHDHKHVPLYH
jgi:hypothetical protein